MAGISEIHKELTGKKLSAIGATIITVLGIASWHMVSYIVTNEIEKTHSRIDVLEAEFAKLSQEKNALTAQGIDIELEIKSIHVKLDEGNKNIDRLSNEISKLRGYLYELSVRKTGSAAANK